MIRTKRITNKVNPKTVRQWKRYAEYRPIRHQWLDSIPSGWEVKRISWLFGVMGSGTTPSTSDDSYFGGGIPWVNTGDLNDSVVGSTQKTVTEKALSEHSALRMYPAGTLLIALYGATIGKLGILTQPAVTNQACFAMANPIGIETRFILYWLLGNRERIIAMAYGGGQPNISGELIRKLRICVPPVVEQRAIAAFLDRETARLDALIAKKERLIALLEEKRQALISHAVTRGLDPDVPLKDSGVAWIGKVPAHWKVTKIGYFAKIGNGSTPERDNPAYWQGGKYPWLNSSVVNSATVDGASDFVTDTALRECHLPFVAPDSVLVAITGEGKTRGKAAYLGFEATINQHLAYITPNPGLVSSKFLRETLGSCYLVLRSISEGAGSTKGAITCEQLRHFRLPIPPLKEQHEIFERVNRETAKYDALLSGIEQGVQWLNEYRTALISAAVTGQIDIRQETPS